MSRFADIVGQEQIKEHLQNAIRLNKVSHAYIISGERSSGKEFLAKTFSMALQCENRQDTEPCQECHSCKQALSKNHPDIIFLTHEKPNTISVDDIRTQINGDVAIKPYSGPKKIYIISDGEKMTVQAQNAILKTIEEPPEYGIIMLLTENADGLLQTILSRCVKLDLGPVEDSLIQKHLIEKFSIPDYEARFAVAFAQGCIGRAESIIVSDTFVQMKDNAMHILKYVQDMTVSELIDAAKSASGYKNDINDYLDLLAMWYRDVLLFKSTNDANLLIFKEELKTIRSQASISSYEGLQNILNAIDKAKRRLRANVNFDLTMELMFLTMKEN